MGRKGRPGVEEANKASNIKATRAEVQQQLAQYQDEALTKVFAAIKKVGTRPAVDYCLAIAIDKGQTEKRRQAALAALEGRVIATTRATSTRCCFSRRPKRRPTACATWRSSGSARCLATRWSASSYPLFASKKWKVRWVAVRDGAQDVGYRSACLTVTVESSLLASCSVGFAMTVSPSRTVRPLKKLQVKGPETPRRRDAIPSIEGGLAALIDGARLFLCQRQSGRCPRLLAPFGGPTRR